MTAACGNRANTYWVVLQFLTLPDQLWFNETTWRCSVVTHVKFTLYACMFSEPLMLLVWRWAAWVWKYHQALAILDHSTGFCTRYVINRFSIPLWVSCKNRAHMMNTRNTRWKHALAEAICDRRVKVTTSCLKDKPDGLGGSSAHVWTVDQIGSFRTATDFPWLMWDK